MRTELITVGPRTPSLEALNLMREKHIGCLPVVSDGKLVGVLTAYDFLTVGSKLFEEKLQEVIDDDALAATASNEGSQKAGA
jgi:CBS domain-containing protein